MRLDPSDEYRGELPRPSMLAALRRARESSWREAIQVIGSERGRPLAQRLLGLAAGDWFNQAPRKPRMRVLVVGSDWGQLTFYLAQHAESVFSLEQVAEKAEFQRIRRRQDAAENVIIVNAPLAKLPFRPDSFDLIALSNVLENLGGKDRAERLEAQRAFLSRLRALLRPGGCLHLAGGNRFRRWWPARERPDAEACLHTPRGYRRLLEAAGFADVSISWVLPSHRLPMQGADLRNRRALSFFARQQGPLAARAKGKSLLLRAAACCRASGLVVSGLSVLARREGPGRSSLLEGICEVLRQRGYCVSARSALRCSPFRRYLTFLTKILYILFDEKTRRPSVVAKIPRWTEGVRWLEREEQAYGLVAARCPQLAESRGAIYLRVDGTPVLCEPFFAGRNFKQCLRSERAHVAVMGWLAAFQGRPGQQAEAISASQHAGPLLESLFSRGGVAPEARGWLKRWFEVVSRADATSGRRVPAHGDLSPNNVLLGRGQVFVTDWDRIDPEGTPWEDFWTFQLSCAFNVGPDGSTRHVSPGNVLACLTGRSEHSRLLALSAAHFLRLTHLPRAALAGGLLGTVLRSIDRDLRERQLPLASSRCYRWVELAAREGFPVWERLEEVIPAS